MPSQKTFTALPELNKARAKITVNTNVIEVAGTGRLIRFL
jgi:hypothetical protein